MEFQNPRDLLTSIEAEIERIPPDEFFNKAKYEKQREAWCAALFGVGLGKLDLDTTVRVNTSNHRLDVDLEIQMPGKRLEFQLVMAKDPDYRLGQVYKEFAKGKRTSGPYRPGKGTRSGPSWIRTAIDKKIKKNYSEAKKLNLLVYVNFDAHQLAYVDVYNECSNTVDEFASIWLLASTQLSSLKAGLHLPAIEGWCEIRNVDEYYA